MVITNNMSVEAPAWSIKGKNYYKYTEHVPGPGTYTPNPADSTRSFKIGKSPRTGKNAKEDYPGPGNYSPEYKSGSPRTV